mmetsp:Transcript_2811/g.7283  ORF Transcript_2811/g.7283 Transcript_2811/m.7283 type:complete len:114 (-) Transcript_2811:725-1066(-)
MQPEPPGENAAAKAGGETKGEMLEENKSARHAVRHGGQSSASEFVNHGLRKWEEGRAKWLRRDNRVCQARRPPPIVDDEVIYDTIFSKPTGWLLPHPVPLSHMVELLEDEWSD